MDRLVLSVVEGADAAGVLAVLTGVEHAVSPKPVVVARRVHNGVAVGAVRFDVKSSRNGQMFAHVLRVCVSRRLRAAHALSTRRVLMDGVAGVLSDHFGETVVVTVHPSRLGVDSWAGWQQPFGSVLLQRAGFPSARKIAAMWGEVI